MRLLQVFVVYVIFMVEFVFFYIEVLLVLRF